jgi:hypothetical protein
MDLPYEVCKQFCDNTPAIVRPVASFLEQPEPEFVSGQTALSLIVSDNRSLANQPSLILRSGG